MMAASGSRIAKRRRVARWLGSERPSSTAALNAVSKRWPWIRHAARWRAISRIRGSYSFTAIHCASFSWAFARSAEPGSSPVSSASSLLKSSLSIALARTTIPSGSERGQRAMSLRAGPCCSKLLDPLAERSRWWCELASADGHPPKRAQRADAGAAPRVEIRVRKARRPSRATIGPSGPLAVRASGRGATPL
jgi:hypothetical protein